MKSKKNSLLRQYVNALRGLADVTGIYRTKSKNRLWNAHVTLILEGRCDWESFTTISFRARHKNPTQAAEELLQKVIWTVDNPHCLFGAGIKLKCKEINNHIGQFKNDG